MSFLQMQNPLLLCNKMSTQVQNNSSSEMLIWINSILETKLGLIDQFASKPVYCQLLDLAIEDHSHGDSNQKAKEAHDKDSKNPQTPARRIKGTLSRSRRLLRGRPAPQCSNLIGVPNGDVSNEGDMNNGRGTQDVSCFAFTDSCSKKSKSRRLIARLSRGG